MKRHPYGPLRRMKTDWFWAMPSARAFVLRTAPKVAALRASIAIAEARNA
jgi:hypothetical protein